MARPIKETPALYGKDAERVRLSIKEAEKRVYSSQEKQQMLSNFSKMQSIATFK
jgi:hypothetical protein